jgi:hypothetical protein
MTLADAFHALAVAGCRLAAAPDGGMTLEVPPGAAIDRAVLEVLAANRDAVAAAIQAPAPPAADLAEYLEARGLAPASAALVLHSAKAFGVKAEAITIEADDQAEPVFFEPGIPCITTTETRWHEPGRGYVTMPAGTGGLVIPQPWAIADDFDRRGIEGLLAGLEKAKAAPHVPVWIAGRARVLEAASIDCQNVTATPGANLMPWRPQRPPETSAP